MIKGRNPNDNITLMNTIFRRGVDESDGKFKEFLTIVYKDLDTGQKYKEEIIDPTYEYFVVKEDGKHVSYNRLFIERDQVEAVEVPYRDLEKDIANRVGLKEYFYENLRNGNKRENQKLHLHPDIFNSDMNIEDHYRYRFGKLYKNEPCSVSKAFFDIEADTISMIGDFPEPGECPINAISLILQEQKQVFVFLLRNKTNPQIEEFEKQVVNGDIFNELAPFIINAVGGIDAAPKYNLVDLKYNFLFYDEDDEINLIKDLFNAINTFKPDFALAWNMGFDVPYIIERVKRLGYMPEDIICHSDFKYKTASYYVDERMKSEFAERGDFALISSYTTFLDQMIHFASRRKGQSKFISFTLDYIGEAIAKVKKLDYKHITTNIAELPYKDYKTFVFYNIMDTIVQYCIEVMTGDIDYVFSKCNLNNTRYSKAHRQTVYLTNRGIKEFYNTDDGYIMGNNSNKYNPPPTGKFPGAFVGDPAKVNDYSRLKIFGRAIDVFNNCDDFDYSALYPSLIRQYNIAPNTQIGMIIIDTKVHDKENMCNIPTWTRATSFAEDLQSHVWLEIATRWFGLADYTQLYHEVEQFFTEIAMATNGLRTHTRDGYLVLMDFYKPGAQLLQEVMIFDDHRKPVETSYNQPNLQRWEEWRNAAIENPNQRF